MAPGQDRLTALQIDLSEGGLMAEVELDAAEEAALHALQAEASTHHGAGQQRRRQALAWLRQRALTDELVANLLVALGLSDG